MNTITNNTMNNYFNQDKLFNVFQFSLDDNDPVKQFINILEGLDLTILKNKAKKNNKAYNPIRLFAVILYAYSENITSTRDIEKACRNRIDFRYILNSNKMPDHSTISRFLNAINDIIDDLFYQYVNRLMKLSNINDDTVYIDGTKIEAYANKYSFVWKKAILKNYEKLNNKKIVLVNEFNNDFSTEFTIIYDIYEYITKYIFKRVYGRGRRKTLKQKYIERIEQINTKEKEYIEKLEILGNRNSYSKTDIDSTFMKMKEDYMRNGQLKPAYNLQIAVQSEYIIDLNIFSNPTDVRTLIPFIDKIKVNYHNIKNVVADAGYESLLNYRYLEENGYISYIKPQYYEQSKKRSFKKDINRPENLIYDEIDNILMRKDGVILEIVEEYFNKRANAVFIRAINPDNGRYINYNKEFRIYSKISYDNITSDIGKRYRLNRSIQVEGAFAVLKECMNLRRLKVRGFDNVKREMMLFSMVYNFNKYISRRLRNKLGNTLHQLKDII